MTPPPPRAALSLLCHPYHTLIPFTGGRTRLKELGRAPGSALVWRMGPAAQPPEAELVRARPGGLALLVVLPDVGRLARNPGLVQLVQELRPQGILPDHRAPSARELAQVLRRPPADLPADVTDYLAWRGLEMDRDTTRLVRRIVELSAELRSVSALARSMYVSRRALGRRFLGRGLPVPSHWLQMSRLLRVALRLQNSDATVFSVAYEFGYPDGFSVSNQMHRLIGVRPTEARERLGWEWILERWLRCEADAGVLAPHLVGRFAREEVRSTHPSGPTPVPGARTASEPSRREKQERREKRSA